MRRIVLLSVLSAAGAVIACSTPETIIPVPTPPTAGVRFINAVPDTGGAYGLDFRFVDIVENSDHFRMTFRNAPSATAPFVSTLTEYKGTLEGSRHFRVFLDDTLQAVASTVIKDSSLTTVALHNYTVMLWGNSRSSGPDKMRLTVWEETVPDPGAQVSLRVVNTTSAPIDVRVYAQSGTAPAAATWPAVPAYSASGYVSVAPGSYMYNVQPAGGGTALFADALAPPGTAATVDIEAVPGSNVKGSALSAFVYPRSVAGSKAPQGAPFAVPSIAFNWDRRPPRTCSPLC